MSTSTAVSNAEPRNPELRKVVSRLKETIQSRLEADAVARELKNARDGAKQQLQSLQDLYSEYGEMFREVANLDHGVLSLEHVHIGPQVEAANAWLDEYEQWVTHHKQNLAWIDNPPRGISLPQIEERIEAGKTAASTLLASGQKLDGELKKLI